MVLDPVSSVHLGGGLLLPDKNINLECFYFHRTGFEQLGNPNRSSGVMTKWWTNALKRREVDIIEEEYQFCFDVFSLKILFLSAQNLLVVTETAF